MSKVKLSNKELYYDLNKTTGVRIYRPISKQIIYDIYKLGKLTNKEITDTLSMAPSTLLRLVKQAEVGLFKGINNKQVLTVTEREPIITTFKEEYKEHILRINGGCTVNEAKESLAFITNYDKAIEAGIDLEFLTTARIVSSNKVTSDNTDDDFTW